MATQNAMRLIKSARQDDAEAQLALGALYLTGGEGLAANPLAAASWFSRAWKNGRAEAAVYIAEGIPPPSRESNCMPLNYVSACQAAVAQGSAVASFHLGELLQAGRGVTQDRQAALAAFARAAEAGHAAAACRLSDLLVEGGGEGAPADVRRWLEQAAERGDAAAARRIADLLWQERDVDAIPWLTPLAEAGEAESMCRLGELLLAAGNPAQGGHWLKRAAQRNHARALWLHGRAHARRLLALAAPVPDVPSSPLAAARLLERAAAQDWAPAWWDLARIFEHVGFSRRDLRAAREHLERAARAGIPEAQLALGERLAARAGDLPAWLAAGRWLEAALDAGQARAEKSLAVIADRAPQWSPQVRAAQRRLLPLLANERPRLAARLALAASFGLTTRETVFFDPAGVGADQGWCLLVDVSAHFHYKPWRLVRVETAAQPETLAAARETFMRTDAVTDLAGNDTRRRARQLDSTARAFCIDPALFVADWRSPSHAASAAAV